MGGISGIKCHQPLVGLSSADGMSHGPRLLLSLNRGDMFSPSTGSLLCHVGAGLSVAACMSLATLRTGGSGHVCQEEELTGWKAGVPGKLDIWGWPEHF